MLHVRTGDVFLCSPVHQILQPSAVGFPALLEGMQDGKVLLGSQDELQ